MKFSKKHLQIVAFLAVYLFALNLWTTPLQTFGLPYGEFDAMSHFMVADYISYHDQSFQSLPPYIDLRYGLDNKYAPHTLWYAPTFHSSLAVMQSVTGERVLPVFLFNAVLASFILISIYFVINRLFGFWPAILSALLLAFSFRDYLPFVWGQWPERFGYAFIPLILYAFFQYYLSVKDEHAKPIYLYLVGILLGVQMMVHPLTFFHSLAGIGILYIFLWLKHKKWAINVKHIGISLALFLLLFVSFPNQNFNVLATFSGDVAEDSNEAKGLDFSRIFSWSLGPADFQGAVPASYFSFDVAHGAWTLPFLLIGIVFLVLRRKDADVFMLAWLVSLYIVMHRDVFDILTHLHRSLSATAHIFVPLTILGLYYLPQLIRTFIKYPKKYATYATYALLILGLYFTVTVNLVQAEETLNENLYNPALSEATFSSYLQTLTPAEYEVAEWLAANTPYNTTISMLGVPHQQPFLSSATAKKIRWSQAVSQQVTRFYMLFEPNGIDVEPHLENDYIVLNYHLILPVQNQEPFTTLLRDMQAFEETVLENHTLVYHQNNIKVYHLE